MSKIVDCLSLTVRGPGVIETYPDEPNAIAPKRYVDDAVAAATGMTESDVSAQLDALHTTVTGETIVAINSLHTTVTGETGVSIAALHATVTGEMASAVDALHATVSGETGTSIATATETLYTTVTSETGASIAAATGSLHTTVTSETGMSIAAATDSLHTTVTGETTAAINSLHTTVTGETATSIAAAIANLPSPNATAPLVYGTWNSGVTSTTVSSGSVLCAITTTSAGAVGMSSASNLGTITASGTHTCKIGYKVRLESLATYTARANLYISGAAVNSDGTDEVRQASLLVLGNRTLVGSAFIAGLTSASTVTVQVTRDAGSFTIVWAEITIESIYST